MEDLVGQTLKGRYRIDAFIGRGGMAEVYRAFDLHRSYDVVLKRYPLRLPSATAGSHPHAPGS